MKAPPAPVVVIERIRNSHLNHPTEHRVVGVGEVALLVSE